MAFKKSAPSSRGLLLVYASSIGLVIVAWTLGGCGKPPADGTAELPAGSSGRDGQSRPASAPPQVGDGAPAGSDSGDGYVGSQACRDCHAELYDSYQSHPMAHSITTVDPAAVPQFFEPGITQFKGERRDYEIESRDGKMVHHEKMLDADGAVLYDQEVVMDYLVGSGQRGQSFLHQRGDKLFVSSLTYYVPAHRWDLSPGYQRDDPLRFDRRVVDECLSCHAGQVAKAGASENTYAAQPFPELAIGCERCHGPGEQHVEFQQGAAPESAVDQIVNPAHLETRQREAVCEQCHLQSMARIPRMGRGHFDFRPGESIEDNWIMLISGSGVDDAGRSSAVSQVVQMRESKCFTGSDGRFGCTSCHDAHSYPLPEERVAFYRNKCSQCHSLETGCSQPMDHRIQQQPDDSCVACHMPTAGASDVPHISLTDHRILKVPAPAQVGEAEQSVAIFDAADKRLPELEVKRGVGLGLLKYSLKAKQPPSPSLAELLVPVLEDHPNDMEVLTALGAIATTIGRDDVARRYYERALETPSGVELALDGLITIEYNARNFAKAGEYIERLLPMRPWDARLYSLQADILMHNGQQEAAVAAALKALEINPTLVFVRQWLVEVFRATGQLDKVQEQLRYIANMQEPPEN